MGAAGLELGQPEGGTVPPLRKRLAAESPETLLAEVSEGSPAGLDEESGEEYPAEWSVAVVGPRGGGLRNTKIIFGNGILCCRGGRAPERLANAADPKLAFPEGIPVGRGKCRSNPRGCRSCRMKGGLVEAEPGCWMMRPRRRLTKASLNDGHWKRLRGFVRTHKNTIGLVREVVPPAASGQVAGICGVS